MTPRSAPGARTTPASSAAVLGIDLAGTVADVGRGVTASLGDEVYGMTGGVGGMPGTLAEYAAVDADCWPRSRPG